MAGGVAALWEGLLAPANQESISPPTYQQRNMQ